MQNDQGFYVEWVQGAASKLFIFSYIKMALLGLEAYVPCWLYFCRPNRRVHRQWQTWTQVTEEGRGLQTAKRKKRKKNSFYEIKNFHEGSSNINISSLSAAGSSRSSIILGQLEGFSWFTRDIRLPQNSHELLFFVCMILVPQLRVAINCHRFLIFHIWWGCSSLSMTLVTWWNSSLFACTIRVDYEQKLVATAASQRLNMSLIH